MEATLVRTVTLKVLARTHAAWAGHATSNIVQDKTLVGNKLWAHLRSVEPTLRTHIAAQKTAEATAKAEKKQRDKQNARKEEGRAAAAQHTRGGRGDRADTKKKSTSVCYAWRDGRKCRFGDDCRFAHTGTTPASDSEASDDAPTRQERKSPRKEGQRRRETHARVAKATEATKKAEQALADAKAAEKRALKHYQAKAKRSARLTKDKKPPLTSSSEESDTDAQSSSSEDDSVHAYLMRKGKAATKRRTKYSEFFISFLCMLTAPLCWWGHLLCAVSRWQPTANADGPRLAGTHPPGNRPTTKHHAAAAAAWQAACHRAVSDR